MSLQADSPVHSSSSDDFAAYLDAELDSKSSESSPKSREEEVDEEEEEEEEEKVAQVELCDLESKRMKRFKAEISENLEDPEGSTSHRALELHLEASSSKDACTHPGSFGDMCIVCGQRLNEESGVTFGYIHKGLRLGNDEIVRLRNTDMKNLLRHRKLYLVLDLDHTLLNSTLLIHITSEEEYLKSQTDSFEDVSKGGLFMLDSMPMMTKLRPFVRTFLKEASKMFEMYIYTMGDRPYALEMAKLLDPKKEYFSAKVISRDDGTQRHQKGLDVVLGQESAVLILDDTENIFRYATMCTFMRSFLVGGIKATDLAISKLAKNLEDSPSWTGKDRFLLEISWTQAWTKHKDNLILMERYHFFGSSCRQYGFNCKSLSELKSDESDSDGALASVLKVLTRIHHMFFDELTTNLEARDVRQVLKTVRKDVLKGCKIVFSRVFPTQFQADNHFLWRMAENLGAICSKELDSSVTHVVSTDAGTEKSRWALKNEKFLVHPQWIEAANFLWEKQPEHKFSVNQTKKE